MFVLGKSSKSFARLSENPNYFSLEKSPPGLANRQRAFGSTLKVDGRRVTFSVGNVTHRVAVSRSWEMELVELEMKVAVKIQNQGGKPPFGVLILDRDGKGVSHVLLERIVHNHHIKRVFSNASARIKDKGLARQVGKNEGGDHTRRVARVRRVGRVRR